MNLSDIIIHDSDRLFFVDSECFIIFTGEGVLDDKPFIRIGTWPEMPADLIPFIENIIVPDGMIGNPAFEQFNIDVRDLENNRYIGSEHILQRFLNYQKVFGLDLTNALVVNIEKDIPELSSEKTVSEKNQFIGVFYRNGNFKTVHGAREIFDLDNARVMTRPLAGIHDMVADSSRSTGKYNSPGMVIIENNPLFCNDGSFTSYLFPGSYLSAFSRLLLSPEKIKAVIHPSGNYMNLTRFMKWKHQKTGQLTIFSDNSQETSLLKALFRNCTLSQRPFEGMHYETGDGVTCLQYRESYNIRVDYKKENISIAFIKGATGISDILKDDLDAIMIEYSVYEESVLLFKSTTVPIILINDTFNNISHRLNDTFLIARQETPYRFLKAETPDTLFSLSGLPDEALSCFKANNPDELKNFFRGLMALEKRNREENIFLYNGYNLLRSLSDTAEDRNVFTAYRSLLQELRRDLPGNFDFPHQMALCFYNRGIYSFIEALEDSPPLSLMDELREKDENSISTLIIEPGQKASLEKIAHDRRRLRLLLQLLLEEKKSHGLFNEGEINRLEEAIAIRKNYYNHDIPETESAYEGTQSRTMISSFLLGGRKKNSPFSDTASSETDNNSEAPAADSADGSETHAVSRLTRKATPHGGKASFIKSKAGITLFSFIILIAALLFFFSIRGNYLADDINNSKKLSADKNEKITRSTDILSRDQKKQYDNLPADFKSNISDTDIYRYANKVAIKNGYSPLKFKEAKINNPHWIFPKNQFILLDEQKITVTEGDTLWGIAKRKLIEMDLKFHDIIKKAENMDGAAKRKSFDEAKKYSFSLKHHSILKESEGNGRGNE